MIQNKPDIYDDWKQRAAICAGRSSPTTAARDGWSAATASTRNAGAGTVSAGDTIGTRLRHLNDHGATWSNGDGKRFVLWEPYGADGEDLTELIAVAHRDRLHLQICPSVWCPPYTIGIRFTARTPR